MQIKDQSVFKTLIASADTFEEADEYICNFLGDGAGYKEKTSWLGETFGIYLVSKSHSSPVSEDVELECDYRGLVDTIISKKWRLGKLACGKASA